MAREWRGPPVVRSTSFCDLPRVQRALHALCKAHSRPAPTYRGARRTYNRSANVDPTADLPPSEFAGTLVKNGEFSEIKKEDFAGKWVVLFSYPMDFTCASASPLSS